MSDQLLSQGPLNGAADAASDENPCMIYHGSTPPLRVELTRNVGDLKRDDAGGRNRLSSFPDRMRVMETTSEAYGMQGIEPLDFIAASRRVLHLASQGPGRIEFLRNVSRLLLDFSGCDALLMIAGPEDGGSRYQWSAVCTPHESFQFERYGGPCLDPSSITTNADSSETPSTWLDDLIGNVLSRQVGPKSRCVTEHGSFWTGDAVSELALVSGLISLPEAVPIEVRSLAAIPFDVSSSIPGVLALLSGRKHAFSAQDVGFYEAVAQTLGLAMDDRRAQHALRERVKELSCLYAIAQVLESLEEPATELIGKIVQLLPSAWQFPAAVVARIRIDKAEFTTGDMSRVVHRQEAPVIVDETPRGFVEVGYVEDRPEFVDGPFLREEEHLIAAIAREVSLFVQRCDSRREKLRLAEQVRQTDRLATLGQLAAGVAHEINEPLGAVLGFAQLAKKLPAVPEPAIRDLDKIIQAALHAREIVRKLMLFARQAPSSRSMVRINDIIAESLSLLASRLTDHRVKVVQDLDPMCPTVFADAVQLNQIVVNLCVNGIQAMPQGGTLIVRTRGSADSVSITIEDTGTGVPPEIREHIFEPFFTTKSPEQGTGLGLSVVHGIVTAHGGTIVFDAKPATGTRFEVCLPTSLPPHGTKDEARDE